MTDDRIPDTDPAPPTAADHDPPEPTIRQVLQRVEDVAAALAQVLARLDTLIADAALCRGEERRHGAELATLRDEVDALPCRGGRNGGAPPLCPEAAE